MNPPPMVSALSPVNAVATNPEMIPIVTINATAIVASAYTCAGAKHSVLHSSSENYHDDEGEREHRRRDGNHELGALYGGRRHEVTKHLQHLRSFPPGASSRYCLGCRTPRYPSLTTRSTFSPTHLIR
jgi:hypothetical protein